MNIGILGTGSIARTMAAEFAKVPAFRCEAVCSRQQTTGEALAQQFGIPKVYTDYDAMLADPDIELVYIATPNSLHYAQTRAALLAGKNVLCEKPAARTYPEALEMQKVQHETGKVLNIGVVNRFNDGVNVIKRIIDSGELGEVYHVYASFRAFRSIPGLGGDFTTKAVAGGGSLIDWGVHYLDIVMYCCGDPAPKTVSGETFCKLGKDMKNYVYTSMWAGPPKYDGTYDVDDSVTALVRTSGPVITVHGAWAQNIKEDECYIDFMGDKGGIRLQYGQNFTLYPSKDGALFTSTPEYISRPHFQNEIDAFVRCVRTGEKLPSHIDYAVLTSKIMQGIYDSAEQHREVVFE